MLLFSSWFLMSFTYQMIQFSQWLLSFIFHLTFSHVLTLVWRFHYLVLDFNPWMARTNHHTRLSQCLDNRCSLHHCIAAWQWTVFHQLNCGFKLWCGKWAGVVPTGGSGGRSYRVKALALGKDSSVWAGDLADTVPGRAFFKIILGCVSWLASQDALLSGLGSATGSNLQKPL